MSLVQAVEPHAAPRSSTAPIIRTFRAMGCDVELLACTTSHFEDVAALLDRATALLTDLEARWSRFRPDSELMRLNRERRVSGVSRETYDLIADAIAAWQITDARFDPTVHDALIAAGYDRSFAALQRCFPSAGPAHAPVDDDAPRDPAPGPVGIDLDDTTRTVSLPDRTTIDLGGIGKGRAADLVTELLVDGGATGACVNLGGDVRLEGIGPHGPWTVGVDDPFADGHDLTTLTLTAGAVATSSRMRRTWTRDGHPAHHLIDPATGRPAARGLAQVTVVAARAQWAEVLAKAAFVAGPELGAELIDERGAAGLLVTDSGAQIRTPGLAAFEIEPE